MSRITLHLTPAAWFEAQDPAAPYVPETFQREGFIHCTDGITNLVDVANRYYRDDPRPFVMLVIDVAKLRAPVKYQDPARIYPHIYGPLDRDAILDVLPVRRIPSGEFQIPKNVKY